MAKPLHIETAETIMTKYTLLYCNGDFYKYDDGVFSYVDEAWLRQLTSRLMRDKFSRTKANEVLSKISADCYTPASEINKTELLNLKNGMFNLETYAITDHSPDLKSTIQLNIEYNEDSLSNLWIETLNQIFENDVEKVKILQEFCGLCLTKDVKYEKALICIGEGRNGKSVILYILEQMIGYQNRSAVSLEYFDNPHYLANLYNKLVNISIETSAKSSVYDANFKSIISGDSIEADPKYKKPFMFRPFCKLVVATNNLPRVDDKSDAFFKRLLILRFNRQFTEEEQNRELKHQLDDEINGVFLWALSGLKRLRKQKNFKIGQSIIDEVAAYRKENNNVIIFIDECCIIDGISDISVGEVYKEYALWCKDSGHKPWSKNKFGREVTRQFKEVSYKRSNVTRYYHGLRLSEVKSDR